MQAPIVDCVRFLKSGAVLDNVVIIEVVRLNHHAEVETGKAGGDDQRAAETSTECGPQAPDLFTAKHWRTTHGAHMHHSHFDCVSC